MAPRRALALSVALTAAFAPDVFTAASSMEVGRGYYEPLHSFHRLLNYRQIRGALTGVKIPSAKDVARVRRARFEEEEKA